MKKRIIIFGLMIILVIMLSGCIDCKCPTLEPTETMTPTEEPTATPIPTPYLLDFDDLPPGVKIVQVVADPPVPLRECARMNESGFCVWGIFGKTIGGTTANRIKINQTGKLVAVYKDCPKGDGGHYACEVVNGQIIAGFYIYFTNLDLEPLGWKPVNFDIFSSPDRTRLYLLEDHIVDYSQ